MSDEPQIPITGKLLNITDYTPMFKRTGDKGRCDHDSNVELDTDARVVICKSCGGTVDPFDYLLRCATKEAVAWNRYAELIESEAKARKSAIWWGRKEQRLRMECAQLKTKK